VIGGVKVGISICEDIWSPFGPLSTQSAGGAELNVNINGSPYEIGKAERRERMIATRAADTHSAIVYVNQVGGQDELVFDGGSLVFDGEGQLLARAPQFREDLMVVDVPIPPVYRKRLLDPRGRRTDVELPLVHVSDAPARADAVGDEPPVSPIAEPLDADRELYDALVLGTRDYCGKNGFTDVVIGLSGGIDSTLVACIAADALGPEHVHGVSMPSRYSSDHSRSDAQLLAENLGISFRTISIEPAFQAYIDMLDESFEGREPGLTFENIQSRCRGQTLMALSNEFGWMVLTTGNKSELAVGYFTIYGDSVGGYAVIKDLLKLRVYDLCRYVNEAAGRDVIPPDVIAKPPSAELRPDQRDDDSLPPYEVLDPILELYVEHDRTAAEIVELGHDEELVRRITRLVDLAEYKRRQTPPGVRVSPKAFGKDRRLPITSGYRG
jgi:NAD+ synthase (glutamine-hydrolysing)